MKTPGEGLEGLSLQCRCFTRIVETDVSLSMIRVLVLHPGVSRVLLLGEALAAFRLTVIQLDAACLRGCKLEHIRRLMLARPNSLESPA